MSPKHISKTKCGRVVAEVILAPRLVEAEEIDVGLAATLVTTVSVTTTTFISTARQ
jgi:hypothetical protein